jgi:prepilin-type processing-associated H-X9-DG protein
MELLVVIAIVAVLAAILVPVVVRAKSGAHAAHCLSNLRQWGQATHLYVNSHDGLLPQDGSPNGTSTLAGWYVDLPRAAGQPTYHEMPWRTNASIPVGRSWWICPSNPRRSNGNNLFHYALNKNVNASGTGNQILLSTVPQPSRTVWMFDNGKLAAVAQQGNVHTNLHRGGAQFTFLDGHASWFPSRAYWDFEARRGRTDNPEFLWFP